MKHDKMIIVRFLKAPVAYSKIGKLVLIGHNSDYLQKRQNYEI